MKRILIVVIAACLVISLAEVAYTLSQPLLGEGDLEGMTEVPEFKILLKYEDNKESYTYSPGEEIANNSGVYKILYYNRPHLNEVEVPMYRLIVLGTGLLDIVVEGAAIYSMGVLNPASYTVGNMTHEELMKLSEEDPSESRRLFDERIKKHGAAGIASSYFNLRDLGTYGHYNDQYEPGEVLMATRLGWILLVERISGMSQIVLEEDLANRLNVNYDEFIEDYANMNKVYLKRAEFAKSVLDTEEPEGGFLILAYYHNYDRLWGILFAIPEEEATTGRVTIDGEEKKFELVYPFIFIDAHMEDGRRNVALVTDSGSYSLDMDVNEKYGYKSLDACVGFKKLTSPEMSMKTSGEFKMILYSESAIDIKDAQIRQSGGEWSGSVLGGLGQLDEYETILLTIKDPSIQGEPRERYDYEVKIVFEKDGELLEEVALCGGRYEP